MENAQPKLPPDFKFNLRKKTIFVFPGPRPFAWPPSLALNMYLPAMAPNLYSSPGPQFVFTGSGSQFVFTSPRPQFVFTGPGVPIPDLYLPV